MKRSFIYAVLCIVICALFVSPFRAMAYMPDTAIDEEIAADQGESYIDDSAALVENSLYLSETITEIMSEHESPAPQESSQIEEAATETSLFPMPMETAAMSEEEMLFFQTQFDEIKSILWSINICLAAMFCVYLVVHYVSRWIN